MIKEEFLKNIPMMIIGSLCMILSALLLLPFPFLTRMIIDEVLPQGDVRQLGIMFLFITLVLILERILNILQRFIFVRINNKIVLNIKMKLIKKVSTISLLTFQKYSPNYLYSRIQIDTQRLNSLFFDTFMSLCQSFLVFIIGVIATLYIQWKLALIAIAFIPLYLIILIIFGKKAKIQAHSTYEISAQTSRKMLESLKIIPLAKSFSRELSPSLRFYRMAKVLFRSKLKLINLSLYSSTLTGFIDRFVPILIFTIGGYLYITGQGTIGDIIAFSAFVGYIFFPLSSIVDVRIQIQKAKVSLNRIEEIMALESESLLSLDTPKIESISLKGVSFSYDSESVLSNVFLYFNKGVIYGVKGKSGAGKTTLLMILSGLYDKYTGSFIVNNKQVPNRHVHLYRKQIAIVSQEPILLDDSIRSNIRFANLNASEKDIYNAAKISNSIEFIDKLENGYDTIISAEYKTLSIGQKQRIAIARAIIKKSKVLILDEPTANLDSESERLILESLIKLKDEMIIILIAHKESIINMCDKIYQISNGKIAELSQKHKIEKEH